MAYYENEDTSVPLRYNRHEKLFFFSTRTKCRGEIFVLVSSPFTNLGQFQNLMTHCENEDASVPRRYNRYENAFCLFDMKKVLLNKMLQHNDLLILQLSAPASG